MMVLCAAFTAALAAVVGATAPKVEPPCIGIDLGTTYSVVGIWQNDKVEIITNEMGNRITPSVVAFTPTERLIGDAARNQMHANYRHTVYAVKRLMGRQHAEPSVQQDQRLLSYAIVADGHGRAAVRVEYKGESKTFKPEEISAMILQKMRDVAKTYLGKEVTNAVITVPAYFNDAQRQATKDAGAIAGLNVVRIINEPTAAAIAFGLDRTDDERRVLVFDLGGGTFDVSLLSIDNGFFEVEATNGDTHLGGEDFDNRVMMHLAAVFEKHTGKNVRSDPRALARLRKAAEEAKRRLSSQPEARVEVDNLVEGIDFSDRLTRGKFEELCGELFRATLDPVKAVLADASVQKSDVHDVVLVGGSTRIPKIQALIKEFFNGKELNRGVDPDEAVAYGAAVHAAVLSGATRNAVMLIDVIPLSLGIETIGGVMLPIIPRNTIIPTQKEQVVTTTSDQQATIDFQVFEGERGMTKDNRLLGRFTLSGIKQAPRGAPQVQVRMAVDENGILHVKATDLDGGASESVEITNDNSRLTKEEVDRMVEEAKEFEEEDRRLRDQALGRAQLEQTIGEYRQRLSSEGFKKVATDEERAITDDAVTETLQWTNDNADATAEELQVRLADLKRRVGDVMDRKVPDEAPEDSAPPSDADVDDDEDEF